METTTTTTQKPIYKQDVFVIGRVKITAESDNKAQLEIITRMIQNAFIKKNEQYSNNF